MQLLKYCKNPEMRHARIASLILEQNPEVELSHRSIRRMVSQERARYTQVVKDGQYAELTYKGQEPIHTLEDAVRYFQVDLDQWEVSRYTCNS